MIIKYCFIFFGILILYKVNGQTIESANIKFKNIDSINVYLTLNDTISIKETALNYISLYRNNSKINKSFQFEILGDLSIHENDTVNCIEYYLKAFDEYLKLGPLLAYRELISISESVFKLSDKIDIKNDYCWYFEYFTNLYSDTIINSNCLIDSNRITDLLNKIEFSKPKHLNGILMLDSLIMNEDSLSEEEYYDYSHRILDILSNDTILNSNVHLFIGNHYYMRNINNEKMIYHYNQVVLNLEHADFDRVNKIKLGCNSRLGKFYMDKGYIESSYKYSNEGIMNFKKIVFKTFEDSAELFICYDNLCQYYKNNNKLDSSLICLNIQFQLLEDYNYINEWAAGNYRRSKIREYEIYYTEDPIKALEYINKALCDSLFALDTNLFFHTWNIKLNLISSTIPDSFYSSLQMFYDNVLKRGLIDKYDIYFDQRFSRYYLNISDLNSAKKYVFKLINSEVDDYIINGIIGDYYFLLKDYDKSQIHLQRAYKQMLSESININDLSKILFNIVVKIVNYYISKSDSPQADAYATEYIALLEKAKEYELLYQFCEFIMERYFIDLRAFNLAHEYIDKLREIEKAELVDLNSDLVIYGKMMYNIKDLEYQALIGNRRNIAIKKFNNLIKSNFKYLIKMNPYNLRNILENIYGFYIRTKDGSVVFYCDSLVSILKNSNIELENSNINLMVLFRKLSDNSFDNGFQPLLKQFKTMIAGMDKNDSLNILFHQIRYSYFQLKYNNYNKNIKSSYENLKMLNSLLSKVNVDNYWFIEEEIIIDMRKIFTELILKYPKYNLIETLPILFRPEFMKDLSKIKQYYYNLSKQELENKIYISDNLKSSNNINNLLFSINKNNIFECLNKSDLLLYIYKLSFEKNEKYIICALSSKIIDTFYLYPEIDAMKFNYFMDSLNDTKYEKFDLTKNNYLNELLNIICNKLGEYKNVYIYAPPEFNKLNINLYRYNFQNSLLANVNIHYLINPFCLFFNKINRKYSNFCYLFGNPLFYGKSNNNKFIAFETERSAGNNVSDTFNKTVWTNLPSSEAEVNSISKILEIKYKSKIYLNKESNVDNYRKISAPYLLHIATHSYNWTTDSTHNYGIVLAPHYSDSLIHESSQYLTNTMIEDCNYFNTKCVVLSLCKSAVGDFDPDENLLNSYFVAGAENVIATLWSIDDEITKEFMIEFYSLLMQKNDIFHAFTTTQLLFKEKYNSPYYWAGFQLFTNTNASKL